jgi:hypothetical protein
MLARISDGLNELELLIASADVRAPAVSGWSVGQQIEHTLLTIRGVVAELVKGKSRTQPPKPTLMGRAILAVGRIPRGRGESPIAVLPRSTPGQRELSVLLKRCRESVRHLAAVHDENTFLHPIFGRLDKKGSIRFLSIHTAHHLRIIRDIVKAPPLKWESTTRGQSESPDMSPAR